MGQPIPSFTCNECGATIEEKSAVWLECPDCEWQYAFCEGCAEDMLLEGFRCNKCCKERDSLLPVTDADSLCD